MTCNPKWTEITENIPRGHQPNDHPMMVARIFKAKYDEMLRDLIEAQVFGTVKANLAVIEFQKRGLPHAHILTTLQQNIVDPVIIDTLISAEIPDRQTEPELYEIVVRNMVHGPCGANFNPNAPCCQDGACSKGYPKTFLNETVVQENGHISYRRRDDGKTITVRVNRRDCELDNRWIVPYNRYTLLKYNCHINVECVSSTNSVKYLYKYFFKSVDMALVRIAVNDRDQVNYDEIETFLNARYLAPPEASWHILQFPMSHNTHTVYRLCVHLPERQVVRFQPGFEQQALDRHETTPLTAWFNLNRIDIQARQYLYTEIPLHYVWQQAQRRWTQRRRGGDKIVVRLYNVNGRNQELYCLRLLLLHVRGAQNYEDLRTVEGNICETFAQASVADAPIDVQQEHNEGIALRNQLNAEQLPLFELILNAVHNNNEPNRLFFINAAAGAGKSFIFRTLITVLRGENVTTLALAPTGIAASLLKDGRTIHSRFRLPLDINETTTTGVTPRSQSGQIIRAAKLVVIDEISMVTRTILGIINAALKDICNDNRPFANKVVVVAGDFRQTLPIVINGNRATIVDECVKHTLQVHNFAQHNLLRNIRADANQQEFCFNIGSSK
ncbi:hypothetical protein NQ317_006821 [Molorchus minor]|uniref:ATP-dependent DNA helicase n=1 Tax=Molorchus minor TaxID=1323400 RepID=A0ABQ9K1Q6_9CUCU|nr:hypothetical protein NQ317_006821 [Molorchus minor]